MKGLSRRDRALLDGYVTYLSLRPCGTCGDRRRRSINGQCAGCMKGIRKSGDAKIRKHLDELFAGRQLIRQHNIALRSLKQGRFKPNKKPPRGG